jgi:hypothetical protein
MVKNNMNSQDPMRALLLEDKGKFLQNMKLHFKPNSPDDELAVNIKSRLLCYESSEKLFKCKDCGAVLTGTLEYLNSNSIIEVYEPNDKRDWVFAYCELLAKYPLIETKKPQTLEHQFLEELPTHLGSLEELQIFRDLYEE